MEKIAWALIALAVIGGSGTASAAPSAGTSCMNTQAAKPSTSQLVDGLGLTPDQVRAARSRLSQYGGANYQGLAGLGLTSAQITEIQRRLGAAGHPEGWPCAPFKNKIRVVRFVAAKLVYNGFRPGIQFFTVSPRQVRFNATQDGIQYYGVVAKTAPRQITIRLDSTRSSGGGGGTFTFALSFDA